MPNSLAPKLSKWPFFVGDAILFGCAFFIYYQSKLPMEPWQIGFVVFCVACGACLGLMPFLLEYRVLAKLAEASLVANAVAELRNIETIAAQISGVSNQWESAQDQANKTVATAGAISERMASELKAFSEFMQRANDSEKANLRLEVEKLHRAEADWLQVLVRLLDHVYALHTGAVRSGQPNLIGQVSGFQNACRDSARRVGLVPYVAEACEPFDPQRHQLLDSEAQATAEATVAETIATGYTFQGRLLRPALVRLSAKNGGIEKDKTQRQSPVEETPAPV